MALLESLSYLSVDGDGVNESQLEQNQQRLKALLNSTTQPADSPVRGL